MGEEGTSATITGKRVRGGDDEAVLNGTAENKSSSSGSGSGSSGVYALPINNNQIKHLDRMEFSSSSSSNSNTHTISSNFNSSSSSTASSAATTLNRNATSSYSFNSSEIFKVLKGDGYRGLYRGIVPELLKVTPMVSITFCVYEFTYDLFSRSEYS